MSEASNVKEVSITPSFTSLVKPTADYIGKELKCFVQERVEKAKEAKRQENLKVHIDKVQEKISTTNCFEPNIHQLDMFEQWVDGASNVDPKSSELSEIWQNLLVEMGQGEDNSEILLTKLKSLTPNDAKTLVRFATLKNTPLSDEDLYRIKNLESLELIEKNELFAPIYKLILTAAILPISFIFIIYGMPKMIGDLFNGLGSFASIITDLAIYGFIPVTIYMALFFSLQHRLRRNGTLTRKSRKLTWIGKAIIDLGTCKQ